MSRSLIPSLARSTILVGLLAVALQGVASAGYYQEIMPVTFTLNAGQNTPGWQIIATHGPNTSTSWDFYGSNPTCSGTVTTNVVFGWGPNGAGNGAGDPGMRPTRIKILSTVLSPLRTSPADSKASRR